ncbi:hypothetical protein [Algisphaera agarilytica]|uniref:DUF998 domain-containing protein n=1 Tax=Algisphaera agarilytica TaxID=1385975 RepID=A0A7X0LM15_9BACT|nr:hypothetical protein [Algisphaera agarilytica]MBB6431489.1 hypothetical protein [Algisphaera agarilytica]
MRRFAQIAGVSALVAACFVGLAGVLAWAYERSGAGIPLGALTRDIASVARVHPLTGAMSQAGLALWAAAAAVCGYSALRHFRAGSHGWIIRFHLVAGAVTVALLVDDAFMVHEHYAPKLLGINEIWVLGLLSGAVFTFLLTYRRFILANRALPLLVMTCMFFGIMLTTDIYQGRMGDANFRHLLEDGMKFMGIAGWLSWLTCCGLILDREMPQSSLARDMVDNLAMAVTINEQLQQAVADIPEPELSAVEAESRSQAGVSSDRPLFDHPEMPHVYPRLNRNALEERTQSAPQADDGA